MGKAKLKKILDARSGRNVALEKQRKQEKAAEKRKAQNAPEVEDEEEVGGVPLDEVEVKVNGKAKDSKNSKKAAKATEKEAEWETDGSEDEDDSEDEEEESMADRARLLDPDSESEQPDPVAARVAIAPYLEDIDSYMLSLEVSEGFPVPLLVETRVRKSEFVLQVDLPGLEFSAVVVRLVC